MLGIKLDDVELREIERAARFCRAVRFKNRNQERTPHWLQKTLKPRSQEIGKTLSEKS
jgi:hypothetical protein